MPDRLGGKVKPLKAPKKLAREDTEEDVAFKERKRKEEAELKAAREKALKSGPMVGGGIKKSGKK